MEDKILIPESILISRESSAYKTSDLQHDLWSSNEYELKGADLRNPRTNRSPGLPAGTMGTREAQGVRGGLRAASETCAEGGARGAGRAGRAESS